jgi:hypothetical protein
VAVERRRGLGGVVGLARDRDDAKQLTEGVDEQVQLAAQAAARAAK